MEASGIDPSMTALFLGYGVSEFLAEYLATHNFSHYYADHDQRVRDASTISSYASLINKRIRLAESQKYPQSADLHTKVIKGIGYELARVLHDENSIDNDAAVEIIDERLSTYYARGFSGVDTKTRDYVWMLFKEYC